MNIDDILRDPENADLPNPGDVSAAKSLWEMFNASRDFVILDKAITFFARLPFEQALANLRFIVNEMGNENFILLCRRPSFKQWYIQNFNNFRF